MVSSNLSFNVTVQSYAKQHDVLTNWTTTISVFSVLYTPGFGRFIADWLIESILYKS